MPKSRVDFIYSGTTYTPANMVQWLFYRGICTFGAFSNYYF